MKKFKTSILFWTLIFTLTMVGLSLGLKLMNLTFLNWVKTMTIVIIFIGIVLGTIQTLKQKVLRYILILAEMIIFIVIIFCNMIFIDHEKIVFKNERYMVQRTHSFLLSNYINYYEYQNIFLRNTKPSIYEVYNNTLSEYLYTIYYDDKGNIISKTVEK